MEFVYEIRISGRDVKIDRDTWNEVRDHARGYKMFYVIFNNKKYKYVHNQTFMDRPTRFDFELLSPDEEGVIDYIYVTEMK